MARRQRELTHAGIDLGWPHQVTLPASAVVGRDYTIVHEFCAGLSLSSAASPPVSRPALSDRRRFGFDRREYGGRSDARVVR
jgi:hypothetical protein